MTASPDLLVPRDAASLRDNNFDAIRLAMALLVVWSHCFAMWYGTEAGEPISLLMAGTYNAGNLGVLAFFTISGYLITLSFERASSPVAFMKKRVARIYPGYLVAVTLCSLVVVPGLSQWTWASLTTADVRGLLSNILLRNYIVPVPEAGTVNGALWSIPYEFWCYIAVLVVGITGLLKRRWIYVLAAVAIMLVRVWLDATDRRPDGGFLSPIIGYAYFWFNVAPPFLIGGAIYLYRSHVPKSRLLLGSLVLLTILAANLPVPDPWRTIATRTLLPPTLAYSVIFVAFSSSVRLPDAARYGDFSYGCYLYGFPAQRLLEHYLRNSINFPTYVLLSLAISLAAGAASWYTVERWFLPRLRRGPDREKVGPPLREETTVVAP